jgi:hypothetical protein
MRPSHPDSEVIGLCAECAMHLPRAPAASRLDGTPKRAYLSTARRTNRTGLMADHKLPVLQGVGRQYYAAHNLVGTNYHDLSEILLDRYVRRAGFLLCLYRLSRLVLSDQVGARREIDGLQAERHVMFK